MPNKPQSAQPHAAFFEHRKRPRKMPRVSAMEHPHLVQAFLSLRIHDAPFSWKKTDKLGLATDTVAILTEKPR